MYIIFTYYLIQLLYLNGVNSIKSQQPHHVKNDLFGDYHVNIEGLDFFLFDDIDVNISWPVNRSIFKEENVDINLYQIVSYMDNNNNINIEIQHLLPLSQNILNDGFKNIHLDYKAISRSNISNNFNALYPSLSDNFHIFVIIIESISNRYVSRYFYYVTLEQEAFKRRLITISQVISGAFIWCKAWKTIDKLIYGNWWTDRPLPDCPNKDPSFSLDTCPELGWIIDSGCNIESDCSFHPGADGCIRDSYSIGQQCCYNNGILCKEPPCAGSVDMFPPGSDIAHFFADVAPYMICKMGLLLKDYAERRPGNQGGGQECVSIIDAKTNNDKVVMSNNNNNNKNKLAIHDVIFIILVLVVMLSIINIFIYCIWNINNDRKMKYNQVMVNSDTEEIENEENVHLNK